MSARLNELTPKQKAFADHLLLGKGPSEAYRLAYPDCKSSSKVVTVKASEAQRHPAVAAYLAQERAKLSAEDYLTRAEAVAILAKIAKAAGRERGATRKEKIAAVAQASRILGYDSPQKVEVKVEGSLLHRIRTGPVAK